MIDLDRTTVAVPGGHTAVVYRGGSGTPVVFLHGVTNISATDPGLLALAEQHEVIAPVHPGFADLAELDDIRTVHDLALYYDDVFDVLGLDGATVVGHSFGGMVAAELAAHVPHRVGRLVLAAPLGLWNEEHPVADLFAVSLLETAPLLFADPTSAPSIIGAGTDASDPDALVTMMVSVLQGLTTAGKFLFPLPDKGLNRRLRRITAPTLIVWGSDDKLAPPAYADDFAALIPDASTTIIDGAGHMVPYERTDEFVKVVSSFVA